MVQDLVYILISNDIVDADENLDLMSAIFHLKIIMLKLSIIYIK